MSLLTSKYHTAELCPNLSLHPLFVASSYSKPSGDRRAGHFYDFHFHFGSDIWSIHRTPRDSALKVYVPSFLSHKFSQEKEGKKDKDCFGYDRTCGVIHRSAKVFPAKVSITAFSFHGRFTDGKALSCWFIYEAWLKGGPQVVWMLQAKLGRSGNQEQ